MVRLVLENIGNSYKFAKSQFSVHTGPGDSVRNTLEAFKLCFYASVMDSLVTEQISMLQDS
jgi:hypothetical protein